MNIKKFSELSGLSADTLRYYEKIALLKNIHRNVSGHRVYSNKDLDWINFVIRLKDTGMPIKEILEYAKLRELGANTLLARQTLLENHRTKLNDHIESQLNHLAALEQKITLYELGKVA
jgi:DNA-binding transcriptional MerR regulator